MPGSVGNAQAYITVPSLAAASYPLSITVNGLPGRTVTVYVNGPGSVTFITPRNAPAGSAATPIEIRGYNFPGATIVYWTSPNGQVTNIVPAPNQIQSEEIQVTIPAALLTTAGTAQVAVGTSGTLSNAVPFVITPFAISNVTPGSVMAGAGDTLLTVAGQSLLGAVSLPSRRRAARPLRSRSAWFRTRMPRPLCRLHC